MDSQEDSWDIRLVLHNVLMPQGLGCQRGVHTVLLRERSKNSGHSRGVPFHHRAQLVEQYTPGHSLGSRLDPRLMVVPAQGAHGALCWPAGGVLRISR